jgi:hypothetical protein
MHYSYFNRFHTYCHDFAGEDEIIFSIALCALAKAVEHPVRVFEVNAAISHFRDHGRPLHSWLYCAVEAAWGSCARCDPPLVMRFVNDPIDELPTSEEAARIRRQRLWNTVGCAGIARAVRAVTIERGRDPRDFTLIAFGGNGPLFAAETARTLEIGTVLVPQAPGVFSAVGLLEAELEHHLVPSGTHPR